MEPITDAVGRIGEQLFEGGCVESSLAQFKELVAGQGIQEWMAGVEDTRELSQFDQEHPNSFNKYVLAVHSATGSKLVLHSWHSGIPFSEAEIHNHRWNFVSAVLKGSIEAQTLQVQSNGDISKLEFGYLSPDGGASFGLLPVGEAKLAVVETTLLAADAVYFQHHGKIHRARPVEASTVTLVLQGPVVNPITRVFRDDRPGEETQIPVKRPSDKTMLEDLARFKSLLLRGL
ncbi:hypothetical protein ACIPY2_05810 [Paenarthrobacter sp. NPDC089675]|uniref:hypothetical protein n=1 Tax=Paenarthrobacter sp. NPDC089675 TaxID=3364376 RepID=UPI0037F19492